MSFTFNSLAFANYGVTVLAGWEPRTATNRPVKGYGLPASDKIWYQQELSAPIEVVFPVRIQGSNLQTTLDSVQAALSSTDDDAVLSFWYADRHWLARWDGIALKCTVLNTTTVTTTIRFLAQPNMIATSASPSSVSITTNPQTVYIPGPLVGDGVVAGNAPVGPVITLRNTGTAIAQNNNEVQTITPAGTWTSGTYTLEVTYANGTSETTAAIALTATAATIKTALAALNGLTDADLTVTGGPLNATGPVVPVVITFIGAYANTPMAMILINVTGIVGGGTATVAETTGGSSASVFQLWNYTTGDYVNYTDSIANGVYVKWDCDARRVYVSTNGTDWTEQSGKVSTNWLTILGGTAARMTVIGVTTTATLSWTYSGRYM